MKMSLDDDGLRDAADAAAAAAGAATTNDTAAPEKQTFELTVSAAEVVVVLLLVIAWLASLSLFLHKWRRFSVIPPRVLGFENYPKNIDSITVIRRPDESVIYRSYPKQVATKMEVRKQMLSRLHAQKAGISIPHHHQSIADVACKLPLIRLQSADDTKLERSAASGADVDRSEEIRVDSSTL